MHGVRLMSLNFVHFYWDIRILDDSDLEDAFEVIQSINGMVDTDWFTSYYNLCLYLISYTIW